ncbi:DciA family protein [Escherichia coli]
MIITTGIAALKQELLFSKPRLIAHINEHLGSNAVSEIVIR